MPGRQLRQFHACTAPAADVRLLHRNPRQEIQVKTFIIEREIPGASALTHDELLGITSTSNDAVASLDKPYTWLHSYVAGDKIYCVHQAEDAEVVKEHSRRGKFPANLVAEVASVFGSTGPRELPV
jgi:hypothetical protein